jgi:hypothetical protein
VPVFKQITYRLPIDRPDGKKGGAYVFFDTELQVDEEKLGKLKKLLADSVAEEHRRLKLHGQPPAPQLGTITFTKGKVNMLLEKDGVLIEKVMGAGKPSLYGNNVATFAVELTPEGAAVFEAAMQGKERRWWRLFTICTSGLSCRPWPLGSGSTQPILFLLPIDRYGLAPLVGGFLPRNDPGKIP